VLVPSEHGGIEELPKSHLPPLLEFFSKTDARRRIGARRGGDRRQGLRGLAAQDHLEPGGITLEENRAPLLGTESHRAKQNPDRPEGESGQDEMAGFIGGSLSGGSLRDDLDAGQRDAAGVPADRSPENTFLPGQQAGMPDQQRTEE
jgi:hypothetical protein